MGLQPLSGGGGGGRLYILMGTSETPSLVTIDISLCPSKLAVLLEARASP